MADEFLEAQDNVLLWLVELAEDFESGSIDITLLVHGTVVTGTMLSSGEYFSRLGNLWAKHFEDPEEREQVDRFWTSQGDRRSGDEEVLRKHEFIHLEDAHIVSPHGLIPEGRGVLWRGHISRVDGFFFDRLGLKKGG